MEGIKRPRHFYLLRGRKSPKAIFGILLGVLSVISCLLTFCFTVNRGGEATVGYGMVILLCLFFSVTGMVLGLLSRKEEDSLYLLSYLAMFLNGVALVLCSIVVFMGMGI